MLGGLALALTGIMLVQSGSSIEQIAGDGRPGASGDGGPAREARLNQPFDAAFDAHGNLYVSDTGNHAIRKIEAKTGIIKRIAGTGQPGFSGDGGPATEARLNEPYGVAIDPAGNLFFADRLNGRVRRVDARTGFITTVAGDGSGRSSGDGGPATAAGLVEPNGVAHDGLGRLYIADVGAHRVRVVVLADGSITTLSGDGRAAHGGDGAPASEASIHGARAVEVGTDGSIYIVEREGNTVRVIDPRTGLISTIAGTGRPGFDGDGGPASAACFRGPKELAAAPDGSLYVVDTENHAVRRIDPSGRITTLAGDGTRGSRGEGRPASKARLDRPHGVAVAPDGAVWIVDTGNHRLLRVAPPRD